MPALVYSAFRAGVLSLGLAALLPCRAALTDAEELQRAAQSPYALQAYFSLHRTFDLSPLWRTLVVTSVMGENYAAGVLPDGRTETVRDAPSVFDSCAGDCELTLAPVALGKQVGKLVLVRMAKPRAEQFRYLLFRQTAANSWRLLGHVDYSLSRYFEPEHRVVTYGGRRWLVFRAQENSGSGLHLAGQYWYELREGELCKVLSIPADGAQRYTIGDPTREFSANVIRYERDGSGERLIVRFVVRYGIWDDLDHKRTPPALGTRVALGVYRRTASGLFEFDPRRSEISEAEIESVFSVDSLDFEQDFLEYNIGNLRRIANDTHEPAHEWLRSYLERCEDSPQRAELLRFFASADAREAW